MVNLSSNTKRRPAKKRKSKTKRRTTISRYVYLFERIDNKSTTSILRGLREIKIGIGVNAKDRNKQVDRGIPGTVIYLTSYYVHNASHVETDIHDKYKKRNFTVKGAKKGAGGTEFYRLRNKDVDNIVQYLERLEVDKRAGKKSASSDWLERPVKRAPIVFVTIITFIFLIINEYFKNH